MIDFIDLNGRRYLWRDVLTNRREQLAAIRKVMQPALFELRHDCQPEAQRTATGSYREPMLFSARADDFGSGNRDRGRVWAKGGRSG